MTSKKDEQLKLISRELVVKTLPNDWSGRFLVLTPHTIRVVSTLISL